jgi:prevent-host-death family protein
MEKVVSAADANRRFSELLREVGDGHSYVVTNHGRAVARLVPVEENYAVLATARKKLLERLWSQPVREVPRDWARDELYERQRRRK